MLDINRHRSILSQILKNIYTDPALGPLLGFKGGTACYFFYDLPRFSVDLDFDLINLTKDEYIIKKIKRIIGKYGKIQEYYNKRYTIFFLLSHLEDHQNIKIEISKRNFGSAYHVLSYLGISMQVMQTQDIFAHKLVALLERKSVANRDLFDIWYFLKNNWDINENIIQLRTKLPSGAYLNKCIKFIETINNQHILSGIGELVNAKTKNWIKANLKTELLFQLQLRQKME